ncbi:MAG: transposase [Turicibacter sp.]|nr:transposase [Turicibacter sp.]
MASETKSIFLYGNPTKVKLKMLSEIQIVYTNKINEFIDLMISDSNYYLDLFNNNKKSPLIRELEKMNRGDLGSALGQNAIDHAVKELHNHLIRIKNDLYGYTIDSDSNVFVSYTSLLNASIQELTYEDVIHLLKSLNPKSKKEQRDYQELITQLETFGKEKVEFLMKDVQTLFNLELRHRKIPLVKKAPVQLDSRLFTLESPEKVKADFVIKIKKLESQKEKGEDIRIPIPIKTSSNSLRRIKQYKKSNTSTFTITEKGKLKIAIPFEKKIVQRSKPTQLRGVDIGITDLMVDSEKNYYGSFVEVNHFYNTKVLPEQGKLNQLRSLMKTYQKELKNKKTPHHRKIALRKKIFNLNSMIMKNKSLSRALRSYYHKQEEVLSKAVNDYFETIKGTEITTVIESLDIQEFNRSKAENRRDSMWARAKLTNKLISKLNWHGFEVIEVDPTYTSQMCSVCGCVHEENRHYKEFKCQHCGMELDADYNASINIEKRALDKELQTIVEKYKYNQTLRHREIKKHLMNQHQMFKAKAL